MRVHIYVLNKTYIAEDLSTGLVAYADSPQLAQQKLESLVADYWQEKKVIVPITKETSDENRIIIEPVNEK
jgi:hypothetical protein